MTILNRIAHIAPKHRPLINVINKIIKNYQSNRVQYSSKSIGTLRKIKQEILSLHFRIKNKEIINARL
jgi:hypothetical protein